MIGLKKEKAAQLKCAVIDEAGQLIWDSKDPGLISHKELVEKLRRRYGSMDQQEKYEAELRARRRRDGETLAELYQDIRCMMVKAYPGEGSSPLYERTAKEYFYAALRDRMLASKLRDKEPKDLEAAFKLAVRIEAQEKADDDFQPREVHTNETRDVPRGRNRGPPIDGLVRRVQELEQKTAAMNVNNQHCKRRRIHDG